MLKFIFLFYNFVLTIALSYKSNFNINLNLVNDSGYIYISSVKLNRNVNSQPNHPQEYQKEEANHGNNEENQKPKNAAYTQPTPAVRPRPFFNSEESTTNSNNNYPVNNRSNYNPTVSNTQHRSNARQYAMNTVGGCVMNKINCALSGVTGEKLNHCLSCANLIYNDNSKCSLYEPASFLSLFSSPTRYGKGGDFGRSLLELGDLGTDLNLEGLSPLNIKPKVSVHDLLYSYDNSHVRVRDVYCNDYECLRLKDPNSCISQLYPQDQYGCGSCWIFANTLHLEILLCMESNKRRVRKFSEMYIASCLSINGRDACKGGNTYDFSQIISQFEFIPSKDNLKYNLPVMNTCPRWDYNWINQKPIIELLTPQDNKLNSFKGFILVLETQYCFQIKRSEYDNKEEFISLIKDMVKEKGSVVISMKGKSVLKPDHDGTKGNRRFEYFSFRTHSMVIIGYGNYVTQYNERRRYWLIRNSWGSNWGDNGNFRLDMDGPNNCNGNVFEYAVVLNVKIKGPNTSVRPGYLPKRISNLGNGITRKINVKFNNKLYTRLLFFNKAEDVNNEIECNRAFSINKNRNDECIEKCKRNINKCKDYNIKDLGVCLFGIDHDYDCMMCGV